ncbi:MAG: helix-turn-helix transcriptional regulator [Candidatus Korobacteraceae bacterium]
MANLPRLTIEQAERRLANYLRTHRKRAGLSQRDLAILLGYPNEGAVSRQERFRSVPPLLVALSYEVLFQAPVADLFAGLREAVEQLVEARLQDFEQTLQQRHGRGPGAAITARKLVWLSERRRSVGS